MTALIPGSKEPSEKPVQSAMKLSGTTKSILTCRTAGFVIKVFAVSRCGVVNAVAGRTILTLFLTLIIARIVNDELEV